MGLDHVVAAERLADVLAMLVSHERTGDPSVALCEVAAEITGTSGASIALTSSEAEITPFASSDETSAALLDLEATLLEGPSVEAIRTGSVNELPVLSDDGGSRWLTYSPEAYGLGARAVFGFPVRIGSVSFGALSLYRDRSGDLSGSQVSDGYLIAAVTGRALLSMQAGALEDVLADDFAGRSAFGFVVHQAAGMVSIQGDLSVKDALVALRAHAFATGQSLNQIAERVVSRRLVLDESTRQWLDVTD